jgi:hypothetical protein
MYAGPPLSLFIALREAGGHVRERSDPFSKRDSLHLFVSLPCGELPGWRCSLIC